MKTNEQPIDREVIEPTIANTTSMKNTVSKEQYDKLLVEKEELTQERDSLKDQLTKSLPYLRNDIPDHFNILGITYTTSIITNSTDTWGRYIPQEATIEISKYKRGELINPQVMNATFYHELSHCIADATGMQNIYENEEVIDRLGRGFMAFLQTRHFLTNEEKEQIKKYNDQIAKEQSNQQ